MDSKDIRKFVEKVLPELDEPGTYVPIINQYLTKEEDWGDNKTRILYALPVPESAAVQNLGIAILTQIANEEMGPDFLGSVSYFPEVKMWKRMKKNNIPMFDNWLFHQWRDFDVVGISSFYALQYLNFIQMIRTAEIPHSSEKRLDSWDYPIVALGGIQTYSAETVADLFDVFFIGEGEEMNVQFLKLLRQRKQEGVSKRDFLLEASKTIQGIYLPWCYQVEYFDKDSPDHKNQIKSIILTDEAKAAGIPQIVLKGCIEFRDRPPVDKTFVSNNSGGSMSIGSCYCANSCSNLCSFCQGSQISLPYREVPQEVAMESARNIVKNTGTKDISPYCFFAGSHVHTSKGIYRIEDIKEVMEQGDLYVYVQGGKQKVDQFHTRMSKYNCMFRTDLGQEIQCTMDHKFWTLNDGWKEAGELSQRDQLLTNLNFEFPAQYQTIDGIKVEESWGWLLGCLMAEEMDSCLDGLKITMADQAAVLYTKVVLQKIFEDLGLKYEVQVQNTVETDIWKAFTSKTEMRFGSVQIYNLLSLMGFDVNAKTVNRHIPDVILHSPKPVVTAFIKAVATQKLFVTEKKWIDKTYGQRQVMLKVHGTYFARELQLLLFQYGLITKIDCDHWGSDVAQRKIEFLGSSKQKFGQEIGVFSDKITKLLKRLRGRDHKLELTDEGYLVTHIDRIFYLEEEVPVYDLGVQRQHEFTVEGLVVHNCFNVSDLSYVNRFTRDLLLEDHMKVSLSSERLDTMNDNFVKATIKSGSRSFTVAVEAASPRGRHILNKNLTEEQILNAFEIMFRNGALKIKVYNIASWPFEQEEDRLYYATLCQKIEELKQKYNAKTQIRLSFTPFQAKPFTMLQWAGMENCKLNDDGEVEFLKTYNGMMESVKAVCDYRFRFGTASNVSLVAQALAFGDRRLFPVVEAIADDPRVNYYGGMGAGKEIVDVFTEYMRKFTTLDWDYFIREKDADEIFPWDAISTGVDKSWLRKMYEAAKEASTTPLEQEGYLRLPCYKKCTVCGVCRSIERGTPEKPKGSAFWPVEIFGEGRHLPQFKYEDHTEDALDMEEVLDEYIKPQKLRVIRLLVDINPKFRYVDAQKLKYRIRRSCNRAGIPIRTDITAASQKILEKAWYSGKEVYELYSADKRFNMAVEEIVQKINENFADEAMQVLRAEWYTGNVMNLGKNFEYVLYSLTFSNEDYTFSTVKDELAVLNSSKSYTVKLKVKSKTKRDTFETVEVNVKDYMYKTFMRDNQDGTWTLFTALSENMTPYDFAAALLHTAKRNLYRIPAIVEEYLLRNTDGAALDMFSNVCMECGGEIEQNIFGEDIDDTYCLEHKYMLQFEHRDIDTKAEYSEDFFEEEDADDKFDVGGHDDDDDTDLEDQVLKKSGNTGV